MYRMTFLLQSLLARSAFRILVSRYEGERKRSKEDILLVEEDQVREYLSNLNTHEPYWDELLSAE